MKRILSLLIVLLVVACGGGETADSPNAPAAETDPTTGLPLNPETIPTDTAFIVEGVIASMNLTPQAAPEFVVRAPSGKTFRLRPQGLPDILFDDGTPVGVDNFSQGMAVRATVRQEAGTAGTGNIPILASDDFTVLLQE